MWNTFLPPLLYLNTPDMWVLNVAIASFRSQYQAAWNLTLVAAMFNAIPVLILFALFSRYYIEGHQLFRAEGIGVFRRYACCLAPSASGGASFRFSSCSTSSGWCAR